MVIPQSRGVALDENSPHSHIGRHAGQLKPLVISLVLENFLSKELASLGKEKFLDVFWLAKLLDLSLFVVSLTKLLDLSLRAPQPPSPQPPSPSSLSLPFSLTSSTYSRSRVPRILPRLPLTPESPSLPSPPLTLSAPSPPLPDESSCLFLRGMNFLTSDTEDDR